VAEAQALIPCACCGELVPAAELEFTFKSPDDYHALDAAARSAPDTFCDRNFCVVGGRRLFVRGLIPLPVHGLDEPYCIGAWAELAEHDWRMARQVWDQPGNDRIPEFPGVIANHLPRTYDISTQGLAVQVQLHDDMRPTFRLVDTAHPLEAEQRDGITPHRALHFTRLIDG
jgi:hypothetical protein